jgi:cytolysin-activating lysine-acyltransferase
MTNARNLSRHPSETSASLAEQLGFVVHLMGFSRTHFRYPVPYISKLVEPAIKHRRIRFFFDARGEPAAFVMWAHVSLETEHRFLATGNWNLHASEWNEGDRLWIIDFAAPTGCVRQVLANLRDEQFANEECICYFRVKGDQVISREMFRNEAVGFFKTPRALPPSFA